MSEAELRLLVEKFIGEFSPEYQQVLNVNNEFYLEDTRHFRNADSRRLDSVFTSHQGVCVVEYKRGVLSNADILECGFGRGYFELCYNQIPNLAMFIFVGEDISQAVEYCHQIKTPNEITVKCLSYAALVNAHLHNYLKWAKLNDENLSLTLENTLNARKQIPPQWITEEKLKSVITALIS